MKSYIQEIRQHTPFAADSGNLRFTFYVLSQIPLCTLNNLDEFLLHTIG